MLLSAVHTQFRIGLYVEFLKLFTYEILKNILQDVSNSVPEALLVSFLTHNIRTKYDQQLEKNHNDS